MTIPQGSFISTKIVIATPEERDGVRGQHLVYQDGYVSWCPADVFQRDYESTQAMSFGSALRCMEEGYKVARSGWNGKGMWICKGLGGFVHATGFWNEHTRAFAADQADSVAEVVPYVLMKTADGKIVMGWLASQTDLFARDWQVVS